MKDGQVSEDVDRSERRRLGAYYTPPALVDFLVEQVLMPWMSSQSTPPRVIDPACGDGRLLEAAGRAITARYGVDARNLLVGAELEPTVAASTAARLGCDMHLGDALALLDARHHGQYDVVLGNPPYLSQLSSATARGRRSSFGGGPYADAAAEFLALAVRLARSEGGRVGLVLPISTLATRDVAPIRRAVEDVASLEVCWWSERSVFDANVRTCVLGWVIGRRERTVRRFVGVPPQPVPSVEAPERSSSWSWLLADALGIPPLPLLDTGGTLADIARATADFRDQYYGLVGYVSDESSGPPLITSGLIDPGRCTWGSTPTSFAKQRFTAPRVDVDRLASVLQTWSHQRLVPKVLVASQTRVIESVTDEAGAWLPSVPVISVLPNLPDGLWHTAAVLSSPIASAVIAHQRVGSGMSTRSLRITAADLNALPLPADRAAWDRAATLLQRGDIDAAAVAMMSAYGCATDRSVLEWWRSNAQRRTRRTV